jgi:hypothetical protein
MGLRQYYISLQQNTYTGDQFWVSGEAQPKLSILSPGDSFTERAVFWVLLLEKTKIGTELFACSATQTSNESWILGVRDTVPVVVLKHSDCRCVGGIQAVVVLKPELVQAQKAHHIHVPRALVPNPNWAVY